MSAAFNVIKECISCISVLAMICQQSKRKHDKSQPDNVPTAVDDSLLQRSSELPFCSSVYQTSSAAGAAAAPQASPFIQHQLFFFFFSWQLQQQDLFRWRAAQGLEEVIRDLVADPGENGSARCSMRSN